MKYLVVLLVVGLGLWMVVARLRGGGRSRPGDGAARQGPAAGGPVAMVACAHCGLHLASTDALADGARLYCSDVHRRLGPGPGPAP